NEQKDGGRSRRHRGRAGTSGVLLPVEQLVGTATRRGRRRRALKELTTKVQGAIGSKSLSGVKIAMITNGNASYWNEAKAGWNDAMKWLGGKGATGEFTEPTSSTASVQVSLLETLTTQGYTGWGVSAVTASSLTTPISQAVAKGVSVIAYDSPLPGTKAQLYIGTPNTTAGCDAGKAM